MSEKRRVDIHGRQYETVASRVDRFRAENPGWSIKTRIVMDDGETIVMRAAILEPQGEGFAVVATGHAEEKRGSSQINRTSALENCETSAIGRALACFGMAGTEFASADEVANAIHQQQAPPKVEPTAREKFWIAVTERDLDRPAVGAALEKRMGKRGTDFTTSDWVQATMVLPDIAAEVEKAVGA